MRGQRQGKCAVGNATQGTVRASSRRKRSGRGMGDNTRDWLCWTGCAVPERAECVVCVSRKCGVLTIALRGATGQTAIPSNYPPFCVCAVMPHQKRVSPKTTNQKGCACLPIPPITAAVGENDADITRFISVEIKLKWENCQNAIVKFIYYQNAISPHNLCGANFEDFSQYSPTTRSSTTMILVSG